MAYVNVAEWKPDQVTEWLKGLDSSILPYLQLFLNNEVNGQQLLNVRSEDLDNLGIKRLGHQELILEAVEHLRNFHYELDRENLQLLALRLSCQAHSLHNELLRHTDSQPVSTQTLADVASVVRAVKPLVCWLDRSPFSGQPESRYADRKTDLLKCSLEIATCAQRDRFAERPVEEIRTSCKKLAVIADDIIQNITDPLILQPASLDLATLRKRGGDDLGFFILPSFHGVHQIGEIKFGSPAHQCGKVEEGDEVVQVNYQTIVGWQRKKVVALFEESSTDVFLTLKKRPRHTKVYGQIYMKPYRLPSKKRAPPYTRWHDNLPSPRPELLTIPDFEIPVVKFVPKTPPSKHITLEPLNSTLISTSSESDDVGSGCDEASIDYELEGHTSPTSMRLYLPKPRVPVQRRATITGSSPTSHLPPVDLEKFWRELKLEKKWKFNGKTPQSHNSNPECRVLRNKSPCEQNERPSTCLGFEKSSSKEYVKHVDYVVKSSISSKGEILSCDSHNAKCSQEQNEDISVPVAVHESKESSQVSNCKEPKSERRFITRLELIVDPRDSRIEFTDITNKNVEVVTSGLQKTQPRLPDSPHAREESPNQQMRKISIESQVGELPIHRERGRLDKSYSTPAYDLSGLDGLNVCQKSQEMSGEAEVAGKPSPKMYTANMSFSGQPAMPDVTSSSTPRALKTPDYSKETVFKFPPVNMTPIPFGQEFKNYDGEGNTNDNCDVNSNPVLHGMVVETINRHLLVSSCGKDSDDDCHDHDLHNNGQDIIRNGSGYSKTVTSIVLNSPDLISDITTRRLYLKSDEDLDNANHVQMQSSPNLDNCEINVDSNRNSPQNKIIFLKAHQSKQAMIPEQSCKENAFLPSDIPSPKFPSDARKPPPTPARHNVPQEILEQPGLQPRIPIKISVNPPEPPPRPVPPNKSPSLPMEQPKSLLRAKMSCKAGATKAVFGSPKVSRKKNPLLAKRRIVGVKELGAADNQGWLYRRLRIGDSGAQWIKGWFILKGTTFYGFKSREAQKADCFISLPGFTTSPAEEVKSRKFAFKVYHTGTVFYFAAESEEELASWLDCLSMATVAVDISTLKTSAAEGAVFSETEDEGDDETEIADSCFPSPKMRKFTNFLSGYSSPSQVLGSAGSPKPARSHQNLTTSSDSKMYDIQKRFGSLKKLGYRSKYSSQLSSQSSSSATSLSNPDQTLDAPSAPHSLDRKVLRFLSSSKSQNVPVPTSQFKSYRRVVATDPGPSFPKHTDGNLAAKGEEVLPDTASSPRCVRNFGVTHSEHDFRRNNRVAEVPGTLTLEQFMLQRQEEERQQSQQTNAVHQYQDRLRERDDDRAVVPSHQDANEGYTEDPVLSRHKSLDKRRSPPPAPPLSPLPHQLPILRPVPAARTILSAPCTSVRRDIVLEPPAIVPRTSKPASVHDVHELRGPFNMIKYAPDTSSEMPCQAPLPSKQPRLKNAAMYQPPPVAFSPSPSFGPSFEMHLDQRGTASSLPEDMWDGSRIKGAGSKIRHFLSPKRGQHPPSCSQLTPSVQPDSSTPTSHRTILGSPRLHRALFRPSDGRKQKGVSTNDNSPSNLYPPSTPAPSSVPTTTLLPVSSPDWASDLASSLSPKPTMGVAMLGKKPPPTVPTSNINSLSGMSPPLSPPQTPLSPPPDYPGLEYPPVFEPGIYSLSDSSTFLTPSSSMYSPSSDAFSAHPPH